MALVHPLFHVYMIKKCVGDPISVIPLRYLGVDESVSYEDVLVDISNWQVNKFRNKEVTSVKALCRNYLVEGSIWEAEADMKPRYPHCFPSTPIQAKGK